MIITLAPVLCLADSTSGTVATSNPRGQTIGTTRRRIDAVWLENSDFKIAIFLEEIDLQSDQNAL